MKKLLLSSLALCVSHLTFAQKLVEIQTPHHTKWVKLLPINISAQTINHITQDLKKPKTYLQSSSFEPSTVQLNMNATPVLDQGMHGSCATFAVTAAIDALIGKGDYISQLCLLTLGQYLSNNAYQKSGWDGSHNSTIIHQILTHGIINKTKQVNSSCAGLTEYPLRSEEIPPNEMSVEAFHQLSEEIPHVNIYNFTKILDLREYSRREKTPAERIRLIKSAISNGDRVTIGVILTTLDGSGAYGKFNKNLDAWVVTPEVISAMHTHDFGGHAMVITGYDDKAIATDIHGNQHQGLFKLRNSWGTDAGDEGNFYMSYEYMANFAYDLIRVRHN